MRYLITCVLVMSLAGVAGAASLTTNVGTVKGTTSPVLCTEPCRTGDINENEPVCYDGYYDYTNGGCNSQGWTQLVPQGGDGISHACGTSGTYYYGYYSYRDTDWFTAIAGTAGSVTQTVTGEFAPMVILIYATAGTISCSNYTYVYNFGVACAANSASAVIPVGSTFWPWVGTEVFGYGVPCGSRYLLDVTNTAGGGPPPIVFGACCLPNGTCEVTRQIYCEAEGGTYMGDGTDCTPGLCGSTPVQHTTWGSVKSLY